MTQVEFGIFGVFLVYINRRNIISILIGITLALCAYFLLFYS
jgi:NADH:ubiquinone oxidoreductase subunit K